MDGPLPKLRNYRDCGYKCNPHNIYVHITGNILRHRDSLHFLWGKHLLHSNGLLFSLEAFGEARMRNFDAKPTGGATIFDYLGRGERFQID